MEIYTSSITTAPTSMPSVALEILRGRQATGFIGFSLARKGEVCLQTAELPRQWAPRPIDGHAVDGTDLSALGATTVVSTDDVATVDPAVDGTLGMNPWSALRRKGRSEKF